jgi:hypothetical protein
LNLSKLITPKIENPKRKFRNIRTPNDIVHSSYKEKGKFNKIFHKSKKNKHNEKVNRFKIRNIIGGL